ncbi:DinB family protein [Chitinophaga defluvii]|uniref:DinB family protein n=1 Tax=Chitinophaga defluvii TaxID=3163343 RepID=A0ABV2T5H7_9BACT
METTAIQVALDHSFQELLHQLTTFDQEQLNIAPFKNSWTAGQLAEHLIKANGGFLEVINGPVQDTPRAPDAKIAEIKGIFLNFETKMQAPAFIIPADIHYEKPYLLSSLQDIKAGLDHATTTLDLTKTCLAFELPVLGYLTRLEAVYFVIYHTQRHLHQLKNIYQQVVSLV